MLGRKQRQTQEDWLAIKRQIRSIVPEVQFMAKFNRAVDEVAKMAQGKTVAFAWSGGKDSLALERVMYAAGVRECVMGMCNLEYRAFLQWVTDHMPEGLEVVNTGQDLDWLTKNLGMLFPQESATSAKWFHIVQHKAQAQYYKRNNLDMIVLGRRKADGNHCGVGNIYTNSEGVTRYSPIADWSHEDIFAAIEYLNIPLPPIYDWPNGYTCGTHAWAARQWTGSIHNGWREVYSIDPSIVVEAAGRIESANQFLQGVK